jgi:two-component system C4-dicarboxylate transport sensor histidine kinase DctB
MPVSLSLPWLEKANHLATLARLLSDTVHEVNNSLQVISGQAELLESVPGAGEVAMRRARSVGAQARNASALLEQLQKFSQAGTGAAGCIPLPQIAQRAVDLRRYSLKRLRIDMTIEPPGEGDLSVAANERVLLQIVLNLIFNAEQALTGRASARIRLRTRRREGAVELTVEDNGPGLLDEAMGADPDAVLTSKRLGIGRHVAQGLAREFGGGVSWTAPDEAGGCRATLSVPAAR